MSADQSSEPLVRLEVKGVPPSLNALFAMNPWGRMRAKKKIQAEFISALRSLGNDSSIQITSSQNITLIVSDIVDLFQTTVKKMSQSKRAKRKPSKRKRR